MPKPSDSTKREISALAAASVWTLYMLSGTVHQLRYPVSHALVFAVAYGAVTYWLMNL